MDTVLEMDSYHADKEAREKRTLYSTLIAVDNIGKDLREWNSSVSINISELQKNMLQRYENNPVMKDALTGKMSIEDSLNELSSINKGIKKFLPHKKNDVHNQRILDIGELIKEPYNLKTKGVFAQDNFVSTSVAVTGLMFACGFALYTALKLIPEFTSLELPPNYLAEHKSELTIFMPAFMSVVFAPLTGLTNNFRRFTDLPINEAKYVDDRIKLYK